ncbi:MAG TPA: hypothetical protein VG714_00945 [Acidobacteriaceae bacterium]|nr:hypothetical protein [Acidobacteriaceae bacterium]
MSAVKDQTEKKRLSLKLDRRNTYGENDKASRKSIPRGKQRQHQNERRSAAQALHTICADTHEDNIANAELLAKVKVAISRRKGFKKKPDEPLGVVLNKRAAGEPRWARFTIKF